MTREARITPVNLRNETNRSTHDLTVSYIKARRSAYLQQFAASSLRVSDVCIVTMLTVS